MCTEVYSDIMARAKRERVVESVVKKANRTGPAQPGPTRPDPARSDPLPQTAVFATPVAFSAFSNDFCTEALRSSQICSEIAANFHPSRKFCVFA